MRHYDHRHTPCVAFVGSKKSQVIGLIIEQYEKFLEILRAEKEADKVTSLNSIPTTNMAGKLPFMGPWVIDSGVTEYITCN